MNNLLSDSFEKVRYPTGGTDDELGYTYSPDATDAVMETFFLKVGDVEKQIESITLLLRKLQDENKKYQNVTKASDMKEIKKKMEGIIDMVKTVALKVKLSLEELDRDNLANRQRPGCGKGSGIDRSRTAMTGALKRKLKDRMSEFQLLRQKIHEDYREVVARRVFTVSGTRPDEDTVEHLIETGKSEQIFANEIQGQGRGEILNALAEIQERRDTVKGIEEKLVQLQQDNRKIYSETTKNATERAHLTIIIIPLVGMFLDMAVLVDAQGEMLDDIEAQVTKAVDHVHSATKVLQKGKELQRSRRKYTCFAIVLLLVVIIIALFSLAKAKNLVKFT